MNKKMLAGILSVAIVWTSVFTTPVFATGAMSVSQNEIAEVTVSENGAVSQNQAVQISQNEVQSEGSVEKQDELVAVDLSQNTKPEGDGSAKATKSAAKNLKVVVKNGNLCVTATVKKKVKSKDTKYYLVTVDPDTGKFEKAIMSVKKTKNVSFTTPIRGAKGVNLIHGKYAIAVKNGSKYTLISKAQFVANPEDAAVYTAPFPTIRSKKGLQGTNSTQMAGGQCFMNCVINTSIASNEQLGGTKYVYNGKTYWFNDLWGGAISEANRKGLVTTCQFMMTWPGTDRYGHLLLNAKNGGAPMRYYAINASNKKSRQLLEAYFCFLAERYSKESCHLDNWVIGNEVNIYPMWFYAGNTGHGKFMENYANLFRIVYYSVKGYNKNARVYICTDHTWTDRCGDWGAKSFMSAFNKEIKKQNKKIQWNLAYHAYPAILTSAATWNDRFTTNSENSEFVTPKNLHILTSYVKKNYGTSCRIILTEQGFTANSGSNVQAAAIAYTFYKAQFDDMIDAVIFRAEYDDPGEVAQGLSFGLIASNGKKRPAYNVYKYMDTPQYEKYTNAYLSTIGVSSWKEVAPNFDASVFDKNNDEE